MAKRDEGFLFRQKMLIEKPLDDVFAFFSDAENLEIITPPQLKFQILSSLPLKIEKGTLIDYRIRLFGFPFYWKTKIKEWDPPFRFVDIQLEGPYRQWIHSHIFEETENGILMTDTVHYILPGLFLKSLINRIFVAPQIKKIFDYRREKIYEIFSNREL